MTGTKLYGRSDVIDGLGHVATRFRHLAFVPLWPLGSYFIVDADGQGRGIPIPLRLKSVLVAYARALLVLASLGAFATAVAIRAQPWGVAALGASVLGFSLSWIAGHLACRPSPGRRARLLADAGLCELVPRRLGEGPALEHPALAQRQAWALQSSNPSLPQAWSQAQRS